MFRRVEKAAAAGGLWFVLEALDNATVKKHFGTGFASQDRLKYSDTLYIQSLLTGVTYSLYKSYGVWRIGRAGAANEIQLKHDKEAIHSLLNLGMQK